jgi:hypothetical protein
VTTPAEQARAAGYSDSEIAQHLAGADKYSQAKAAGYSDADIVAHYAQPASTSARKPFDRKAFAEQEATAATARKVDNTRELGKDIFKSLGDTALSMGAQILLTPVAGIAGAVSAPFVGMDKAADIVHAVQGAGYQPKSDAGKQTAEVLGKVVEKANIPGEWVAEKTGSPALGAATTMIMQGAVAAADPAVRGAFRSVGGAAARTVAEASRPGAPAAPRVEPTMPPPTPEAVQAAQNYARTNGLDWAGLSDGIRSRLTQIAATSGDFAGLDPKAIARQAQLEALPVPVPATRGQIAGDRVAIRNEGNVAATRAGQPIADIHVAANQALIDNLDVLKGKVSGVGATAAKATTPEEAGAAVQGAARGKQAQIKAQVRSLYDKARETEPNARASLAPVTDLLTSNPEIQHLGWVQSWLNKGAKARQNLDRATSPARAEAEGPVAMTDASLSELHDLRNQASAIARTGGKEGYYAGQVVKAIDGSMESVPEGAAAWRAANDAYKGMQREFKDQGAVADLVSNASATDRTTALSNTVKSVTSGAPEQIRQIKRTLLTGGDETSRTAGRQAWREVRAPVIQQIKDDATRGVGVVEGGAPNLTPSALNSALKRFGPQKLDEIFGPGTARQLDRLLEATKIVKTVPSTGGGSVGSSTVQNALAFLEKGLIAGAGKVPVVGKIIGGAAQAASDSFVSAKTIKQAQTTPPVRARVRRFAKAWPLESRQRPHFLRLAPSRGGRSIHGDLAAAGQTTVLQPRRRAAGRRQGVHLRRRNHQPADDLYGCRRPCAEREPGHS